MSVKKNPSTISISVGRSRQLQKELEQLHARRMAITMLIESLEDYDRFRVRRVADQRLRTA